MLFNKKTTWETILSSYTKEPRDVKTVPLYKEGIWFYVYAENNNIYIENAQNHENGSAIKKRRLLDKENFDTMLTLYYKRKKGEKVSKEAISTTHNQVYWYGIFSDLNL